LISYPHAAPTICRLLQFRLGRASKTQPVLQLKDQQCAAFKARAESRFEPAAPTCRGATVAATFAHPSRRVICPSSGDSVQLCSISFRADGSGHRGARSNCGVPACAFCWTRGRGCNAHPALLHPLISLGGNRFAKLGRIVPRECGAVLSRLPRAVLAGRGRGEVTSNVSCTVGKATCPP
jgi:hypothetical protein